MVGSDWYSTCAMSGMVLALPSVSSLVSSASPPAALLKVTWIFGWALFQTATVLSMFGTQDRKVRVTFWFASAEAEALPEPLHAAPATGPPVAVGRGFPDSGGAEAVDLR